MCPPRLPTVIFQLTLKPPKVYYIANSGFVAFKCVKSATWGVLSRVDSTKIVTPGELMTLPLIPSRLRRGYPFPILHTIASSASQSRRLGSSPRTKPSRCHRKPTYPWLNYCERCYRWRCCYNAPNFTMVVKLFSCSRSAVARYCFWRLSSVHACMQSAH